MKRQLIGAIVGAIIIFAWQFFSWAAGNLHEKAQRYTPNQEAILSALAANLPEEGGYLVPNIPSGSSDEQMEKAVKDMEGKPWASIQYHKAHSMNMGMNVARQFIVNIIVAWLFIWLVSKFNVRTFGGILLSSLAVGLIVFLNSPYTGSIWYDWFDIMAHFTDAMVSWGLVGLWLGWLLSRRTEVRR